MNNDNNYIRLKQRYQALTQDQKTTFLEQLQQQGLSIDFDQLHQDTTSDDSSVHATTRQIDISLCYFSAGQNEHSSTQYQFILETARDADKAGFHAIWLPERHFANFGGLHPNPAVLAAAIATQTQKIAIRSGSVVLPLHNPLRVAEEWALVDQLSEGRAGVGFASGWHSNDFVMAPEQYTQRKQELFSRLETVISLWRGQPRMLPNGENQLTETLTYPRPYSSESLPIWLTTNSGDMFERAGQLGLHVLTSLITSDLESCAENIRRYRAALKQHHPEKKGNVTLLMHTFLFPEHITSDETKAITQQIRQSLSDYLKTFLSMSEQYIENNLADSLDNIWDNNAQADEIYQYFLTNKTLIGSQSVCQKMLNRLKQADVDEVACLIDFGLSNELIRQSLSSLSQLQKKKEKQGR
ncbi:MupA/Atu3671 family FMN-dependent luciferase-like monooxygenase [Vibrio mangrovi]|uniref:Alkanal monooxygenase alpha chain n=1 Tax=Vibrio mangrovi TaxID=474394 RepID=A0A1Y6IWX4_9VIBR|nr:MupA/Atu3671 family FMN-dependent luciferase-like monooxygenase [Vibrio mangrovi]MDW6005414.1 LLM class flavin-dependent oxidoreductase [Vibrio mangrovi]SMS02146.1 Alkanal monooxygenase alpha chain [Vibrio mangrovi]